MARMVNCIKLKKEAEGLDRPLYLGELGQRIWENVSKKAWAGWISHQTMLVNENRLNLADIRARKYLAQQMENYFFGDGAERESLNLLLNPYRDILVNRAQNDILKRQICSCFLMFSVISDALRRLAAG